MLLAYLLFTYYDYLFKPHYGLVYSFAILIPLTLPAAPSGRYTYSAFVECRRIRMRTLRVTA